MPPATKPASAPVRAKSVGAIRRTAQTTAANGTTAMMGMETRHSIQPSAIAMLCQCQSGAETRLIVASAATATGGQGTGADFDGETTPGRTNRNKYAVPAITITVAKIIFAQKYVSAFGALRSMRMPGNVNAVPIATTVPKMTVAGDRWARRLC